MANHWASRPVRDQPLVSIVIATYNCAEDLAACVDSIRRQKHGGFEVLVADGASTDGTVDAIRAYADLIAWSCSEPDEGIYDAWNKAIPHCRGNWIWFIGADDRIMDGAFEVVSAALLAEESERAGFVYFPLEAEGPDSAETQCWGRPVEKVGWQLKHGMPIHMPHSSMLHRRDLFGEYELFDPAFRSAGDYAFVLRVTGGDAGAFRFVPGRSVLRKGLGGISSSQRTLNIGEFRLAREANGMRGITLPWLFVFFRSVLRDRLSRFSRGP